MFRHNTSFYLTYGTVGPSPNFFIRLPHVPCLSLVNRASAPVCLFFKKKRVRSFGLQSSPRFSPPPPFITTNDDHRRLEEKEGARKARAGVGGAQKRRTERAGKVRRAREEAKAQDGL